MTSFKPIVVFLALCCASLLPSIGAAADDVAGLRVEMKSMHDDYAKRTAALEARIAQLEAAADLKAAQSATAATVPEPPPPSPAPSNSAPPAGGTRSGTSAFNPAISLILAGNYTQTSEDPQSW